METIDNFLRFLNSYPTWAKIAVAGGFIAVVLVLIFTPRRNPHEESKQDALARRYFLVVRAVTLYPENPSAEVQVFFAVNGLEFKFPSVAGVEWMNIGPFMSGKTVEVPPSVEYVVSFRMRLRPSANEPAAELDSKQQMHIPIREASSQSMIRVPRSNLPFRGSYSLYDVQNGVRGASVRASIDFEILADGQSKEESAIFLR